MTVQIKVYVKTILQAIPQWNLGLRGDEMVNWNLGSAEGTQNLLQANLGKAVIQVRLDANACLCLRIAGRFLCLDQR